LRIHWLQHVPFEGLGSIESWALARGVALTTTRLHAGESLPALAAIDGLVVMGGPMSVHDVDAHPWLTAELRFVEEVLRAEKRMLGICLGAQIMARALAAPVRRNAHREIGWFPISWTPGAKGTSLFADMPTDPLVPHWHGETFEIPRGCVHLATSEACRNQAFMTQDGKGVAFQCHPEMRPAGLDALTRHASRDLAPGPYVQRADEILAKPERCATLAPMMERILDRLFAPARSEHDDVAHP
jgi:GMP synthase-like glutamine amidotransferase